MKRILFLMPALPGGGAEKVLIDILKSFDYSRYNVTLFLEYREGVYLGDLPAEVELLTLHGENNLWFQRFHRRLLERGLYAWFHEKVYRRQFLRLLGDRCFDTIVSFMEGAAVKFHSYIFDRAYRNVSWVHIDLKKKHWSLDFFRNSEDEYQCYSQMDKIVFVSSDACDKFYELFPGINADRCEVIYNLIDVDGIRRKSISSEPIKDKFTICMVGRLNRQKRYDRAISAAAILCGEGYDFYLWILGVGELENAIREQVSKNNLEGTVILKGFVKPPYPYVAKVDVFLNVSESEGYPLTLCEALCLGCPVVATAITGAHEILGDSEFGLLVQEDIASICAGLKRMLDDVCLREHYAKKALERSRIFSVEETMNKIYSIL